MIKLLLATLFFIYAQANIEIKIKKINNSLENFDKQYSSVNTELSRTAKEILKYEKSLLRLKDEIKNLDLELLNKEKNYKKYKTLLETQSATQIQLKKKQSQLKYKLVFMLSKHVTISQIVDDEAAIDEKSIMSEEIMNALLKLTKKDVTKLQREFTKTDKEVKKLQGSISNLSNKILVIDSKRQSVAKKAKSQVSLLSKLDKKKKGHKKALERVLSKQRSMKQTLRELKIIKEDQIKKAIAAEKEAKRLKEKKKKNKYKDATLSKSELPKVRKQKSSLKAGKTIKYVGKKTIAPLKSYKVLKKYGSYVDPVYNIKIFNESVSLKPKSKDAKVRNVLNGKVILAKSNPMLNNVIIIEHANEMHTIYANLEKIAPTIKKGKRVKKGAVIGRINKALMFEVTKKNYHINPLQMISKSL